MSYSIMLVYSPTQLALNQLLYQRLRDASCHHGHLDVNGPEAYLSLSGQKTDGGTIFFWEFGQHFHQVVADYLRESYDEHTAQLTIHVDVARADFQYARLTKAQQAADEAAAQQRAAEQRQKLSCMLPHQPRQD
ncbi:MAG: hypothetical protein EOO56_12875 [Hymenobacter sp.]|nr:MAG: hypothetical protein EOO56_12875 [Hymenobacter sp.]